MKTPRVPPMFPIMSGMVILASFVTVQTSFSSKLILIRAVFSVFFTQIIGYPSCKYIEYSLQEAARSPMENLGGEMFQLGKEYANFLQSF